MSKKTIRNRCQCCNRDADYCGCSAEELHPSNRCERCCMNAVCGNCGHCILDHSKPGQEHCGKCLNMHCRFVDERESRMFERLHAGTW